MRVQLYVYDLSNGLASSISLAFLGTHIDAVYHTSIVMEGLEYVYDGGIKTVEAGKTYLGKPMQVLELGTTDLPMDVIMECLESLKEVYTAESYDIFSHNCNNFSNDFATFLTGQGIPEHITNLPQKVLNTPFGRALRPEINKIVQRKKERRDGLLGITSPANLPQTRQKRSASVRIATTLLELEKLLSEAEKSCALVFFTSHTCGYCKNLYPLYEKLAVEASHKATLILVDILRAADVKKKYAVRDTPTFMSFLQGVEDNRWSASDPEILRGNIKLLINAAWPSHPHQSLHLPALLGANTKPVLYSKIPPLGKLKAKMGHTADEAAIAGVLHFVSARATEGPNEATLPDLDAFSRFLHSAPSKLPPEIIFTIVDLMRLAMVDPRFSGYYAEEKDHATVAPLISYVNSIKDCPYSLRLVALQLACNLFSSPLYPIHILSCPTLRSPIVQLITTSLLDDQHHSVRVAAASLSFNMAAASSKLRTEEHLESMPEEDQVELAASLLEAIEQEELSPEALKGFLLALGYIIYCIPKDGEMVDLLKTMDAQGTVLSKRKLFPEEALVKDIGEVLLGKVLE